MDISPLESVNCPIQLASNVPASKKTALLLGNNRPDAQTPLVSVFPAKPRRQPPPDALSLEMEFFPIA